MDGDRLAASREVRDRPESVADDEYSALGLPEGDLLPDAVPSDAQEPAAIREIPEVHAQIRDAEPGRDCSRVAFVAVEKLHDSRRLAEHADPLVNPAGVERIEHEHGSVHLERVGRPLEVAGLAPTEAAVELVAELEGQPPRNVWYRRNTFRQMMTAAIAHAATFVSLVFTREPMRSRRLVKMTSGTSANGMPKERTTWLMTRARLGSTPMARMTSGGARVSARRRKSGIGGWMKPCITTWPDIVPIDDDEKPEARSAIPKRTAAPVPSSDSKLE